MKWYTVVVDGHDCGHAHRSAGTAEKCRAKLRRDNPCKWHGGVILVDDPLENATRIYNPADGKEETK